MHRLLRLVLPGLLAFGLLAAAAGATHNADQHFKMTEVFTSPTSRSGGIMRSSVTTPGIPGSHPVAGPAAECGSSTSRIPPVRSW